MDTSTSPISPPCSEVSCARYASAMRRSAVMRMTVSGQFLTDSVNPLTLGGSHGTASVVETILDGGLVPSPDRHTSKAP